ncbi:hypothetical protein BCR32DRAFT_264959 [Anaeromyces robustus]|uniref:Uncharacterized protein n=1 Tax=Anaeromyces robustus TaxID=1754192 RepID=A0A1Y1XKX9_9FUNG|nr:hypothetical protein BCR32DRAFT_264959 [Anaeromyces robustus]|eukprot:ORX86420.1 hypothetical protein BCR32DRAFT_264959 [Anaeromyces robustus]
MKCFKLLALFITLYVGISYTLNCDEAKTILNIEYDGNCCDLQQINCDESNENILSIESLLDMDDNDYNDIDNEKNLYRRKGGGHGGGGHGGGHSSSHSSGSHSSGHVSGARAGGAGSTSSSPNSFKPTYFLWAFTIILLFKLI